MRRQAGDIENLLGDIFCSQWSSGPVQRIGCSLIALVAHQGELRLRQPRRDIRNPHAGCYQVAAQVVAELLHERLARAIDMATRIGPAACDRADIDDAGALAGFDQRWQQRMGDIDQPGDIGVDHGVPIVQVGLLRRFRC